MLVLHKKKKTSIASEWDSRGVTFVVRLRRDIKFDRLEAFEQLDDKEQDILVDEAIRLTGEDTSKQYSRPLRSVVIYRPYDSSSRSRGRD